MRNPFQINRLISLCTRLNHSGLNQNYSNTIVIAVLNTIYFHDERKFITPPFIIEELVHVFPKYFEKNHMGYIVPRFSQKTATEFVLPWFFGLNNNEFQHLFIANKQQPSIYGGEILNPFSPPEK